MYHNSQHNNNNDNNNNNHAYKRQSSQPIKIESSSFIRNHNDRDHMHGVKRTVVGQTSSSSPFYRNDRVRDSSSSSSSASSDHPHGDDDYHEYNNGYTGYTSYPHDKDQGIAQPQAVHTTNMTMNHDHDNPNVLSSSPFKREMMGSRRNTSPSNHLMVGSLPSSRRERRFQVSLGNHERLQQHTSNYNHYGYTMTMSNRLARHGNDGFGGGGGGIDGGDNDLSKSMPVPRAPFLASRKDVDTGERLSSIPNMSLPQSVTEHTHASSVPYGSLNESRFRFPSNATTTTNSTSTTTTPNNPLSLSPIRPMTDFRQKFQQMRMEGSLIKNDGGGLASLLQRKNTNDGVVASGSLSSSPTMTMATSTVATASGVGSGVATSGGGIGSLFEPSMSRSLEAQQQQQYQQEEEEIKMHPNTVLSQDPMDTNAGEKDDTDNTLPLSTSLTGLSILQTSPRGMLDLDPEEREAIASLRSASVSRSRSRSGSISRIQDVRTSSKMERMVPNIPVSLHASSEEDNNILQGTRRSFSSDMNHHSHMMVVEGNSGENESDEFFNLDME